MFTRDQMVDEIDQMQEMFSDVRIDADDSGLLNTYFQLHYWSCYNKMPSCVYYCETNDQVRYYFHVIVGPEDHMYVAIPYRADHLGVVIEITDLEQLSPLIYGTVLPRTRNREEFVLHKLLDTRDMCYEIALDTILSLLMEEYGRGILTDDEFAIPETREYPMCGKAFVEYAIYTFNLCNPKNQSSLATRLLTIEMPKYQIPKSALYSDNVMLKEGE